MSMADLKVMLSGGATGAGNTDPLVSIGGVLTTTEVLSQAVARTTSKITGVTVNDGNGNAEGNGTITFTATGTALQYTPPAGAIGLAVNVSADGDYFIQGANNGGAIHVTVVASSLPTGNTTDAVAITNLKEKVLDNTTKPESLAGKTIYRCLWISNEGTTLDDDDAIDVEVWINANTPGQDTISIGIADEAASTGAGVAGVDYPVILANEASVPASVVFSAPVTQADSLQLGNLSSTAGTTHCRAIWEKLVVPAGVDEEELRNTFSLSIAAKV